MDAEAARGVTFGVAEARATASLVGTDIELVRQTPANTTTLAAVIVASAQPAARWPVSVPRLHLNGDAKPGPCDFILTPSTAGREALRSQWLARDENSKWRTAATEIIEWHGSLRAFGAADLNQRFEVATGTPLSARSWAGWNAIKIAVDAALRRTASTSRCEAIASGRFDGHKGTALTFDPVHASSSSRCMWSCGETPSKCWM